MKMFLSELEFLGIEVHCSKFGLFQHAIFTSLEKLLYVYVCVCVFIFLCTLPFFL